MPEAEGSAVVLPDTPEYAAAMAAKVDANQAAAEQAAAGDSAVKAPEDDKAGAPEGEQQQAEQKADESATGIENSEEAAKEALNEKGIDYSALQSEFDAKGELTEESYKKLAEVGFPKEVVDAFIAGQAALVAQFEQQGFEAAGGKEQLDHMREWAKGSLNKQELEAYNKAIAGTHEEMLQAVRGLRNRYESEYGKQPRFLGGSPAQAGSQGYASRAEMTADMRDRRYESDPAFRAKVTAKLAATTAF